MNMADGHWLSHAPESFLQSEVARQIAGDGYTVYIDCSGKRTKAEMGPTRGRPPINLGQRFDISVWYKHKDELWAVIEIKRAWGITSVRKDANKIEHDATLKHRAHAGYILVYSEAKGTGYDVKILRKIVTLRRQDRDKRNEEAEILDLYLAALGEV